MTFWSTIIVKQYRHDVTLRRICLNILPRKAESVKHYECVSVFLPSLFGMKIEILCTILYFHLWPVWVYHSIRHYSIKGMTYRKSLLQKCWVSLRPDEYFSPWLLIFVDATCGTFVIVPILATIVLKWLLDFWKFFVTLLCSDGN
jgi:hypothetical protein